MRHVGVGFALSCAASAFAVSANPALAQQQQKVGAPPEALNMRLGWQDGDQYADQGSHKTWLLTKMVMVVSRRPSWGGSLRGGFQRCEFWSSVPELSAVTSVPA